MLEALKRFDEVSFVHGHGWRVSEVFSWSYRCSGKSFQTMRSRLRECRDSVHIKQFEFPLLLPYCLLSCVPFPGSPFHPISRFHATLLSVPGGLPGSICSQPPELSGAAEVEAAREVGAGAKTRRRGSRAIIAWDHSSPATQSVWIILYCKLAQRP